MIFEETIADKIREIIYHDNNENDAIDTIVLILKELSVQPQSVKPLETINRTIDMICEEKFG